MTADSLWDLYCHYRQFAESDRILEIGPGYGRILQTALTRKIPFAEFVGVDLSAARVQRLRHQFPQDRIRFAVGDIAEWRDDHAFDVILCSATFEHLYPDCRKALGNLRTQLSAGGRAMIDFIWGDKPSAVFEDNGTYVRVYPIEELRSVFTESGFAIDAIDTCTLGIGAYGPVERFLVNARPTSPASAEA